MEPQFIVEIDCTKAELFKACYDYRYESTSYPTASKVLIFCFIVGFFHHFFFCFFRFFIPTILMRFCVFASLYTFYPQLFIISVFLIFGNIVPLQRNIILV